MLLNLEQAVEVIIGKGRFLFIRFYNFRNTHKRAIEIGSNQSIVVGKPVSHCVQTAVMDAVFALAGSWLMLADEIFSTASYVFPSILATG